MPQLNYICNNFTTSNAATVRPECGDLVTISSIKYRIIGVDHHTVYLELYNVPPTLPQYLTMLHQLDDCQYQQWYDSLSIKERGNLSVLLDCNLLTTRTYCLAYYKVSYDCDTLVYYHHGAWHAINTELHATAKAATIAELLNYWAEATEHVRYDEPVE
jgi:hypothetical protein